jgi:EAL and modified HD-GYP domain-containing signal transduction protein
VSSLDVVVGRQPIFDADLVVSGYELLRREVQPPAHAPGAGDILTADAVFASASAASALTGTKRAFCGATPGVLDGTVPVAMAPERTVIEISRTARIDDNVSFACRRLREQGFTIALEDVMFFDASEGLLELADIVKMDLNGLDEEQLPWLRDQCHAAGASMVARHVDAPADFERGRALGFDLFQGYLLSSPHPEPGRTFDAGRLARMRMSAQLLDQEFAIDDIEEIIRSDPAMTHQLLQLAGIGAAGGMRRTVSTVREALVLVGWRRLQGWVALLMLTDRGTTSDEVIATTLARARMAELLATVVDPALGGPAFMAGLLSCLDVLTGAPIDDVIGNLPVTDELRAAVVSQEGPLGAVVADSIDYQQGHHARAGRTGVSELDLVQASVDALVWAVEMAGAMEPAAAR